MRAVEGRFGASPGFALLSVLLIAALVTIAAGGLLSVAASSASLVHSDDEGSRALGVAEQGFARAMERFRWGWTMGESPIEGQAAGGGAYSVVANEIPPGSPLWPSREAFPATLPSDSLCAYSVSCEGSLGVTRRTIRAVVAVSLDGLPRGLAVGGDAVIAAPLRLLGCGLYAAGNVTGREFVTLEPPSDAAARIEESLPDLAYGGIYESAAVHAGEAIAAAGCEVHAPGETSYLSDDDPHTGGGPPSEIVAAPDPLTLAALAAHAGDPGAALLAGRLHLDQLPPHAVADDWPTCPETGMIVVIDSRDTSVPIVIDGDRDRVAGARPVTIVVLGDCCLGTAPPARLQSGFEGELVVTGRLTTMGATVIHGCVFAGSLDCRSSLTVDASCLAGSSWQESAPGSSNVSIASWND